MKKILVIEDEPEMRRNLATILRLENFHPLTAAGGRRTAGLETQRRSDSRRRSFSPCFPKSSGFRIVSRSLLHSTSSVGGL